MFRFVTSHSGTFIELLLVDERNLELFRVSFLVSQARSFSKMLSGHATGSVECGRTTLGVICYEEGVQVLIDNGGPYLDFKVALTHSQAADLVSTINMHVHAVETGDDAGDGPPSTGEEKDPADWWKV